MHSNNFFNSNTKENYHYTTTIKDRDNETSKFQITYKKILSLNL